jgi:hypothetical protein
MLVAEPDNISMSCAEVRKIILHLQSLASATAATTNNRELIEAKNELKVLKAHCRLGDYAGKVYNDLKEHITDQPLPKHSTDLSIIFKQVVQKGSKGANGRVMRAFQASAEYLAVNIDKNMDTETAMFAVDTYSARNLAFHSESMRLNTAADWPSLGHQISQDLQELESILPDGEGQHIDKWRRIICYFRDRHIVLGEMGTWEQRQEEKSQADDVFDNPSCPTADLSGLPTRVWQQPSITVSFATHPPALLNVGPSPGRIRRKARASPGKERPRVLLTVRSRPRKSAWQWRAQRRGSRNG